MRIVHTLPYEIKEEENRWIPLSDGTRLAARIWRPVISDREPVPAILEMIPYRKRDFSALRDSINHPYLAGHGYACARVDLRGSGDSEGVLTDEYLDRELRDGEEVLAWLASQVWCSGRTGMMGISWGGFNSLQVAARRPPSLRAIAALSCSDDRYADDVHYMGGCLLSDNLSWASTMFAYNTAPPDPALVGRRWRAMWHQRLERSGLWLEHWLRHQHRDEYWRHGSIRQNYEAIACPVLAVSGWADGYSNAVFRLMQHLRVPRLGLIGPWSHKYPHLGQPGPAIGFLQELVRWWDHWLKDIDNGVMDGPMLSVWMQESVPPSTSYAERPGRWLGVPSWPARVRRTRYPLGRHRVLPSGATYTGPPLDIESPLSVGQFAGKWCSYNAPPDLPYDQREEDGGSLIFDSDVLDQRLEILGGPILNLDVQVNRPTAMVAVRLSDIAPDGRATRVTYGLLNLTHRDGHAEPTLLIPGVHYRVGIQLNGVAHAFPPGHRFRVSVSTSYWPLAWPPPEPVRLTVHPRTSSLVLPVHDEWETRRPPASPQFGEPESTPPLRMTRIEPQEHGWTVRRDLVEYESTLEVVKDLGVVSLDDIDLEITRRAVERYSWVADDFGSVRGDIEWVMGFRRGQWSVRTVTRTMLTSDATRFFVHAQLDAYEGDQRVAASNWHRVIPRDHV